MKIKFLCLAALCAGVLALRAAVPPAEKLLPSDTLAVLTVPDWDKARAAGKQFPYFQLWQDPAMKPFVDKFTARLKEKAIEPLEHELGVRLADYADLVHGQFTLAVIQNGWTGEPKGEPAVVLLVDSGDREGALKKAVADLNQKLLDKGRKLKKEKIRDVEFTSLLLAENGESKSGGDEEKKRSGPDQLHIGLSGSLLIVATDAKVIEPLLARQAGSSAAALGELPAYAANHAALFRDSTGYLWVNFKTVADMITKSIAAAAKDKEDQPGLVPPADKIMAALGLSTTTTLAFTLSNSGEGALTQFFIGTPESTRRGLWKIFTPDTKDAGPLPFVPADVTGYMRARFDWQKIFAVLEKTLNDISPQIGAVIKMGLDTAGKDKDPNFDFRKQFIGNLGNDYVKIDRPPRSARPADLANAPSLILFGSPNPEALINAFRGSMPGDSGLKEREFLGRKIYSLQLPPMPNRGPMTAHVAPAGGYLAFSLDVATLEEYLRNSQSTSKPLAELPGLAEAAQKVGGMGTGWFGYYNATEVVKIIFETVRQDPKAIEKMLNLNPLGGAAEEKNEWREWFDPALLPGFDKVAKYFYFGVVGVSSQPEGISLKAFSPTPPLLKK